MKKYDVYGVGNALVDSEYEIHEAFLETAGIRKGTTALIELEDRVKLLEMLKKHEHQVIKQAGGGSAANTIVAVSQLGGNSFYTCRVANDAIGDFFLKDLAEAGVDTNMSGKASQRDAGHTGECISMITPDAERTMATHLGITANVALTDIDETAIQNSTYLYLEGYMVSSPDNFRVCQKAQEIARAAGVKVSLTLSDPAMVENFRNEFDTLISKGVDLVFCNREEAMLWSNTTTSQDAIKALESRFPSFALTLGSSGSVVYDGRLHEIASVPVKAVDTTGAGDIFAGSFLYGITNGMSFSEAGALGSRAASLLVSNFGARLSQDEMNRLRQI